MVHLVVILCAIVLATMVYRYDVYDREPWYMLLLAMLLGGTGCWAVGAMEDGLLNQIDGGELNPLTMAAVAAVCEETCKLGAVLLIAVGLRKFFADPMDGVIYGAFAGLGFALRESHFYVEIAERLYPSNSTTDLAGQEAVRLMLHVLTGAMDGFGVGLAVCRIRFAKLILPGWFTAATLIHFLWDYACGLADRPADLAAALFQRCTAVSLMLFSTILFGVAVCVGVKWSKVIHGANQPHRLWGWPFTLIRKPPVALPRRDYLD